MNRCLLFLFALLYSQESSAATFKLIKTFEVGLPVVEVLLSEFQTEFDVNGIKCVVGPVYRLGDFRTQRDLTCTVNDVEVSKSASCVHKPHKSESIASFAIVHKGRRVNPLLSCEQ